MNLLFAVAWLVVALTTFVLSWTSPELPFLWIRGSGIHIGWLALAFCAYNLVRWYCLRAGDERRRLLRDPPRRHFEGRAPREDFAPNPDFNFTEQPPRRTGEEIRRPPS